MIIALLSLLTLPIWFGATTNVQTYVCLPPEVPVITSPATGAVVTPNSPISIEGSSTTDSTVTLSDNGDVFAVITADEFDYFATQTSFAPGAHVLSVVAQNPCGSNTGSNVTISAETSSTTTGAGGVVVLPALSEPVAGSELGFRIISPRNNTTTTGASIYVAGTTSVPTLLQVFVNDKLVADITRASTSFGVNIPLTTGDNILRIVITDASDTTKSEESSLLITRKPIRHDDVNVNSFSTYQSWYLTTTGKTAIIIAIIFIIALIVIFLFL